MGSCVDFCRGSLQVLSGAGNVFPDHPASLEDRHVFGAILVRGFGGKRPGGFSEFDGLPLPKQGGIGIRPSMPFGRSMA